ncbi:hypothetical protein MASR2M15_01370 [Anaerolineales bacterium]
MMDKKLTQQIQAALDGDLSPEEEMQLQEQLNSEPAVSDAYERLNQVEQVLKIAPFTRAPERLAATIMARLAFAMEDEFQGFEALSESMREAILTSMTLSITAMMPSMIAGSYMVLQSQANPQLLSAVLYQTISLQVMMMDAMLIVLERIELLLKNEPEQAQIAISLMPMTLMAILESMESLILDKFEAS